VHELDRESSVNQQRLMKQNQKNKI